MRWNNAQFYWNVVPIFSSLAIFACGDQVAGAFVNCRDGRWGKKRGKCRDAVVHRCNCSLATIAHRTQIIKFTGKDTIIDVRNRSCNDDATSINCQKREHQMKEDKRKCKEYNDQYAISLHFLNFLKRKRINKRDAVFEWKLTINLRKIICKRI